MGNTESSSRKKCTPNIAVLTASFNELLKMEAG